MATPRKLEKIERERGKPLDGLILPLVNRGGQKEAAKRLDVSEATISKWLKDNGYVATTLWTKATTPQERADIDAAAEHVNARRIAQGLPTLEEEREAEFS